MEQLERLKIGLEARRVCNIAGMVAHLLGKNVSMYGAFAMVHYKSILQSIGFNSPPEFEYALEQYSQDPEIFPRPEKATMRIMLRWGDYPRTLDGRVVYTPVDDNECDISIVTGRNSSSVTVGDHLVVSEEVDEEYCRQNNIDIRLSPISDRIATCVNFVGERTVLMAMRQGSTPWIPSSESLFLCRNLVWLSIKDVYVSLGISAEQVHKGNVEYKWQNDVLVNGLRNGTIAIYKKKEAEDDVWILRPGINIALDVEKVKHVIPSWKYDMTSLEEQAGRSITDEEFLFAMMDAIKYRFDVDLEYVEAKF